MAALPRITVENLLDTYLSFPDDIRARSAPFHIGLAIIKYFLGDDWIERHLNPLKSAEGFMRLRLQESERSFIQTFKTVDLGELLFNLQRVEGFDSCITRMKTEKYVESGLAELDFGRMLFINGHKFRFVEPRGKRGDNYDLEIRYSKWQVCADVKCKLEGHDIGRNIVLNALKGARDQVPGNKPGMILIKVPQPWTQKFLYEQLLTETAMEFLRTTKRIVSVKYFIAPYAVIGETFAQRHAFKEIANPNNRFDSGQKWELFTYRPSLGRSPNAMPPTWRRLINFPNGLLRGSP